MKNRVLVAALCSGLSCSVFAIDKPASGISEAERIEVMQTGRYSNVKNIAPDDQINPLKVVVQTLIPQSIETVRETIEFLLIRSGYLLADDEVLSAEAKILLSHNLPQVHRALGPMTLDQALHTLSGDAFELVVDPVNRKVAFELSEKIARIY
jgi:type IV pili sensor histidine kinase/response regulator